MSYQDRFDSFISRHPYREIEAGGAVFRAVVAGGEGRKGLVFLNGGLNMSEMWMDYVDELSSGFRVLIFDNPRELRTCEELAEGIHALFRKFGMEKPILVGASFGGMEAQVIARRYPGEIGGMILLSTGGIDRATIKSLKMKYFVTPLLIRYMKKCDYEKMKPKLIKSGCSHAKNESPEAQQYVKEMFTFLFRDYTKEKDLHATGLLWDLTKLKPVVASDFEYLKGKIMMILPEADFFSPKMQRNLIGLMHDPEIRYIKGGHVHTVLRPDIYTKAIREFADKI